MALHGGGHPGRRARPPPCFLTTEIRSYERLCGIAAGLSATGHIDMMTTGLLSHPRKHSHIECYRTFREPLINFVTKPY